MFTSIVCDNATYMNASLIFPSGSARRASSTGARWNFSRTTSAYTVTRANAAASGRGTSAPSAMLCVGISKRTANGRSHFIWKLPGVAARNRSTIACPGFGDQRFRTVRGSVSRAAFCGRSSLGGHGFDRQRETALLVCGDRADTDQLACDLDAKIVTDGHDNGVLPRLRVGRVPDVAFD